MPRERGRERVGEVKATKRADRDAKCDAQDGEQGATARTAVMVAAVAVNEVVKEGADAAADDALQMPGGDGREEGSDGGSRGRAAAS